jgi:hypothetical protein
LIARALCLYNLGHSQEAVALRIAADHRKAIKLGIARAKNAQAA